MIENLSVVDTTGLALVSAGDLVIPREDSQAVLTAVRDEGLVLEFPVEIEVRIVPACDPDEHVGTTLARLTAALEALA